MAQDPYSELGVAKGASQAEIKKAFHKLAKELHPDRNPGDKSSEERFKRVSAAFDFLSDEDQRKRFDRGEIDADGRETFRGFGGGRRSAGPGQSGFGGQNAGFSSQGFDPADLEDIFSVFGGLGGRGRAQQPPPPPQGVDVRAKLDIDLEDTIEGATKRIGFSDGRTLDVTIPKGASDGQTLRLKGQGQQGRGGAFGDALIELKVRPHPVFKREGASADLTMDLPVSVPDAVLGGKVEAPTPDGTVSLNVPKGSNSGATLRLKGKGAVDPKTGKRGDLMARLMVTLPDKPDAELEKFAEAWRKDRPYTPRRKG
ncbi:MAG TPA: J domain-containing protein [Caulobacteraceae bacterium]